MHMPKPSPIPDALTKPFWDACNEERLVLQHCTADNEYQYPPRETCASCGSDANLEWKEVSGRGTILGYAVMYDCRVRLLQADQPFNIALVVPDEDPQINMYSNLPGVPVDDVPVGAKVQVIFETTPTTGQKVPEWRVVR
jgi:uncharacterized OB-fold protein